ncbi:putative MFS sugar transporter [Roridomyces roridus]|uniref:MFS sugar transporter n=1 Tax=Roridomyces roridus TaxID=1738132 RepID=A0AAD7BTC4_9AGAR|nr:putative MFS sugar transporter [Roridomyces roridus]
MQKYFGLRGDALSGAMIWAVILPAYLLFGYNQSVAGGLLDLPSWVAQFPQIDTVNTTGAQKAHNTQIQGTIVAVYTLGALLGSLSCIVVGDKLGRKRTIMLGAAITSIGSILQASSFSFAQLVIGRLITGFGFAEISTTAPNWQTECSRAGHRGFLVMLEGFFLSGGLAVAAWINFGLSHTTSSVSWRFSLAFSCFFAIIVFCSVPLWPESVARQEGRIEEARHVLAALDDSPADGPEVAEQLREIELSLQETGKGSFRDVFRNGPARFANRAFIAALAQCFQQMGGINVLGFYQTTIFRTFLNLDSSTSRILSATVFTWQMMFAPVGAFTIERLGRRKLMLFGAAGMGLCMAVIAGCVSHPENRTALHVAIAFIYLYSPFFVTGYLGLAFLYSSEIAPLSVRTPITALSSTSTWLFNFTVVEATPTGFNSLGYKYFIIYACINWFLILPTVYFLFPETQGLHLESVDRIFLESKSILDPVRVARELRAHAAVGKDGDIQLDDGMQKKEKAMDEMEKGSR